MHITIREPVSSLTHLVAMFLTAGSSIPLLIKSYSLGIVYMIVMLIFAASMILLYGASAFYQGLDLSQSIVRILRKLDHAMIFVLIAGSYTPICILVLEPYIGIPLLLVVWGFSFIGILLNFYG